jgi:hypothetical protein
MRRTRGPRRPTASRDRARAGLRANTSVASRARVAHAFAHSRAATHNAHIYLRTSLGVVTAAVNATSAALRTNARRSTTVADVTGTFVDAFGVADARAATEARRGAARVAARAHGAVVANVDVGASIAGVEVWRAARLCGWVSICLWNLSDMHTALYVLQYESNVDLWGHLRRFDRATAETLATHVS